LRRRGRSKEPPEYDIAVLRWLAEEGPINKYRVSEALSRRLHVSMNTILYAVLDVEKRGLIRIDHSKPARGLSGFSNYYDLSLAGLLYLISHIRDLGLTGDTDRNNLFRHLAVKYHSLIPGVFDLWHACLEAGGEDEAIQRLFLFCKSLWLAIERGMDDVGAEAIAKENSAEFFLDPFLIRQAFFQDIEMMALQFKGIDESWIEIVRKNERLRKRTAAAIVSEVERFVSRANSVLKALPANEIAVEDPNRLRVLQTEIEELSFAVRMLEDASALKFVHGRE